MAVSMTELSRDPIYESFLAAPVGEDRTGTNVSVLSMLARLDIDPWVEAADLAKMPETRARHRLEALLVRFTDVPAIVTDRSTLAQSLLDFLPVDGKTARQSTHAPDGSSIKSPNGKMIFWIFATLLFVGWMVKLAQGT